ncbi:MAG: DUF503 domain-containing protein [Deltaproteobacteria bacterium]|nr:DUF503 domain-containing protein [Deltaproteobacteria bacterium]
MFVAVARITLSIPEAGSLKSKRHVVHKVLDKVKARFNVSAAEVADLDLWQRATLGIASVANEHTFAQESISKVVRFIEEMYVAPVVSWTSEVIPLGGDLFGEDDTSFAGEARSTVRTLADAEREAAGVEHADDLPELHSPTPHPRDRGGRPGKSGKKALSDEERARAIEDLRRRLRDSRRAASRRLGDEDP